VMVVIAALTAIDVALMVLGLNRFFRKAVS
jgi:hypothetical protein